MPLPRLALCLLLAAFLPAAAPAADVAADTYDVGVAVVDITPAHPIRLNGFGFRRAESEGVAHKIHARALAIRHPDDPAPAVLLTVDVLGIPADMRDELARRLRDKARLPSERLAITATHTHCGPMLKGANPTLFGVPIPKEHLDHIEQYTPVFLDRLEEVALAALKDARPATLSFGVGTVGFARNRRKQGGPTDHDLPVLVVRDAKTNKVRAVYTSYACHCVTLSHNKIGGDWAGYAAEAIADRLGGAVGLVSIGCGADQNPDTGVTGDKVEAAQVQGRLVAAEVARLVGAALAPVRGRVGCTVEAIDLPLADLPERAVWEERAKKTDAVGHHARVQLAKLDRKEPLLTKIAYPVQTWAFGESLALVHLPGEVVVDYALRLKTELDRGRVWVTAYANNNPCYIPSERVLKEGGYEGGGAMIYYDVPVPFKPGLEEPIVAAVKKQIGKAFAAGFEPGRTDGSRPLSPQQSHRAIRVGNGYAVDLVAAEPLVADPVTIAFGPDGKLWVAEMLDYPSGKSGKFEPGGRVRYLEDADGDGLPDRATTFLEPVPFPTGVLPWRKGVLVCAAPDILYAEDTDGDGKADKVVKLYSGFGTSNYQGRVNSLAYGLDGWVYGSCGLFGGRIVAHKTGKLLALGDRDFRIRPDTGEIEPATGRTQQGRVRNDWGDWFGCDNSNLGWHYALADHYLKRNPFVPTPRAVVNLPTGDDVNRLYPIGTPQLFKLTGPAGRTTSACGLGVYRDDHLDLTGNVFTCEPVNNLVHRRRLEPRGYTFTGLRPAGEGDREFLASTDPWFRPVQAITGPDGGLWVVDMYRFVIEHPRWIPPADVARLDLRAGAGLGRLYRVRRADAAPRPWPRLDKLDTAGLVAALDSPSGWQRDLATEMLAWRNDDAAKPLLAKLASDGKRPEARLHALVALDRLGGPTADLVRAALADEHAGVRRHAARLSEPLLDREPTLGPALARLAADADAQVRLQAAYSLGAWHDARAGAALAALAKKGADEPFLLAAVVSSLHRDNFRGVVEASDVSGPLLPPLLATAIGLGDERTMATLLERVTRAEEGRYRPWQFAAVETVLDAWQRAGKRDLPASVATVLTTARAVAVDAKAEAGVRVAAVRLLGRVPKQRGEDVPKLATLLEAQVPGPVQAAAVASLGRVPDDAAANALIVAWPGLTPPLQAQALDALLAREAWVRKLLAAIADGKIPASAIRAGRRQGLVTHPDAALRRLAEKALGEAPRPERQKVIDEYRASLPKAGDPGRGAEVFKKSCAACHRLDGVGNAVGPDLAALANKSAEYLLAEVLDPNRNLDTRYVEYAAVRTDGRVMRGLLAGESATALTLVDVEGKEATLLRADLESLRASGRSLMPEGLEKEVPPAAMADLLAYLAGVGKPPKRFPGNEPKVVRPANGRLTLRATDCAIHGNDIVFEPEFRNIGYWHGSKDHVVWRVELEKPAEYDVWLDYACEPASAGNPVALDGGTPTLRAKIASTGAWTNYRWVRLGTVKLTAGGHRLTFRPDTDAVRGALLDLRTVVLVPPGEKP